MAVEYRPAGFSDDSDSDFDDFLERPRRQYNPFQHDDSKKKIENALQEAIINNDIEALKKIIATDLSNNVNTKLDSGWTPLIHACFHAQDEIVKYLLDEGADPNLNDDSVTPLMAACSNDSADSEAIFNIINQLIQKNAILNIGDKYGQTPLMRAINNGRIAIVQELLRHNVNIEMRDQQGWTAAFWAVHHNQPEIVEILINHGARLTEVDKIGRTILEIATLHGFETIIDSIKKHLNITEEDESDMQVNGHLQDWKDYYPGVKSNFRPTYKDEIAHLLYGMNCEKLLPKFREADMDLRTFLLLDDDDMVRLGIELPFEKKRLRLGLRRFHTKSWMIASTAGIYEHRKNKPYSVLECLTTLGSHLQQLYVIEASMQYAIRELAKLKLRDSIGSGSDNELKDESAKVLKNISSIRIQLKEMKSYLRKISKSNPAPADLIVEKHSSSLLRYLRKAAVFGSLAYVGFSVKTVICNYLK